MPSQAHVLRPADHHKFWLFTERIAPLLTAGQTDGRLAMFLTEVRKGCGSPPHVHTREDEGFLVLDGQVTFLYGDTLVTAGPGDFVWGPRGVAHNFTGSSDTPAKMLLLFAPTRVERFFDGFTRPDDGTEVWPAPRQADIDTILRTAPDYGIDLLPPTHPMPTKTVAVGGATRRRWVMGERVGYLATADQTAGACTVVDITTAPAGGPPPHTHTDADEILYVTDGTHEVLLDDRTETVGPGDTVWVPRGTRHRYGNVGDRPGKILSVHTPGGFERFFDEAGVDADHYPVEPKLAPPSPAALADLLARHGMTV